MTDIAWLLRNDVPCGAGVCCAGELCNQAAEEIERLRQVLENARQARVLQRKALVNAANEIYRLRAALERFACTCDRAGNAECSSGEVDCPFWQARAALEGKRDDKA